MRVASVQFQLLGLAAVAQIAGAQSTLVVGPGGPPNYPTIQSAVIAALAGDTVRVTQGTYYEQIEFQGLDIIVESISGPGLTIINATPPGGVSLGSVVTVRRSETNACVLRGFTITGGVNAQGGAGIRIESASPTIEGNVITQNGDTSALGPGGGVYAAPQTPFSPPVPSSKILGNTISLNVATVGGGMYFEKLTPWAVGSPTSINTISGNTATSVGGGVYLADTGTVEFDYCTITGNTAATSGGGIYASGLRLRLDDSKVNQNTANADGGGLYCSNLEPGSFVTASEFLSNTASNGSGGAIACVDSSPWIYGCTMKLNFADLCGGAIDLNGNCNATVETNAFVRSNRALSRGGAISIRAPSNAGYTASSLLTGNTITNSHAGLEGGGIYCAFVAPTIELNTMKRNGIAFPATAPSLPVSTTDSGGGIVILGDALASRPTISANAIEDCYAVVRGGGMSLNGSTARIVGNTLDSNGALLLPGGNFDYTFDGGGIYIENGAPEIDGNMIIRNQVRSGGLGAGVNVTNPLPGMVFTDNFVVRNWAHVGAGGGMYLVGSPSVRSVTFTHNTFADNIDADSDVAPTVYGLGHAIHVDVNIIVTLRNSIIRGPAGPSTTDGLPIQTAAAAISPTVEWTNIGPIDGPLPPWFVGGGVINVSPGFVNPAIDDYHLLPTSLCRDAGNSLIGGTTPTDFDGDPRPLVVGGPAVDLGADEVP